ncbi:hypothetical protein R1sor_015103 [Riccia sorocarpa]|uniref:Reverse transcriptase zinc-binding domain-containing protein n=1 Tax=Riccia sorocarpa TaxID=122646 RepID=A0ABD3HF63_9MARC
MERSRPNTIGIRPRTHTREVPSSLHRRMSREDTHLGSVPAITSSRHKTDLEGKKSPSVCLGAKEEYFTELVRILDKFELISGAKVNLAKSLVMPLGRTTIPNWANDIGCEVIQGERLFKYLGVISGVQVPVGAVVDEAVRKIQRRIFQWESAYLPWPARVVLLKHVLSQIPTYTMLAIGCSKVEAQKLEKICRLFFWGATSAGKPRKALIAWKRLCRPKLLGGLGFLAFETRAKALQMRFVSAILDNQDTEWVAMAQRMIQVQLMTGPNKIERRQWEAGTALLLLKSWRFPDAPTLDNLCKVWFAVKKKLHLVDPDQLPAKLPIPSLKMLWNVMGLPDSSDFIRIQQGARRAQLKSLQDLRTVEDKLDLSRITGWDGFQTPASEVHQWLQNIQVGDISLTTMGGWSWVNGNAVTSGWKQPASEWTRLLSTKTLRFHKLSRWWGLQPGTNGWDSRWKQLWSGPALNRHKLWIWKILNLGFCTLSKVEQWGVSDGICQWCHQDRETVEHLFWSCRRIQGRVQWIREVLAEQGIVPRTMLEAIDGTLQNHSKQPGALLLLGEHFNVCWSERNKFLFEQQVNYATPQQIITTTEFNCQAVWRKLRGDRADQVRTRDEELLAKAKSCWRETRDRQARVEAILRVAAGESTGAARSLADGTLDEDRRDLNSCSSESSSDSDSVTQ